MSFTVMTFNIHRAIGLDGKVDLGRIAADIRKAGADVAALQELDKFQPRTHWKNQLRILARELGMHFAFAPSINLGFIQYGIGTLSRFPIVSKSVTYMRGRKERRSVLIVKVKAGEDTVAIANTHLGVFERERRVQMPRLLAAVEPLEYPAVLLGDFNMAANHPLLGQLKGAWRKVPLEKKYPTLIYGGEIDHIFVKNGVTATARVQPTAASDHNAVIARLSW